MTFAGLMIIGLLAIGGFLSVRDWINSKRCNRHASFGRCKRCEEEAAANLKAIAEEEAETERKRLEIEQIFEEMDIASREELMAIVVERVQRLHLLAGNLELKEAVVKLYKKRGRTCND